jgi:hypothetical protein
VSIAAPTAIHRGICVDNRDPLSQGRIRVQIPSLLGPLASGWAFPAWGMAELEIAPVDRLPGQGQGVWVFVDGENLFWFAVYGPQSRPVPEVYEPTLKWQLPVMPLTVPVTIAGVLSSSTGTPNPDPAVQLQGKTGSTWSAIATFSVGLDGAFSFTHIRTAEDLFRIWFPGTGPYPELYSDERAPPTPPNTATISWAPPAAVWMVAEAVTGRLASSPDAAAAAGSTVRLLVRDGTAGAWLQEGAATTDALGGYAIPWTRARTGLINMQVVFLGTSLAGYAETEIASSPAVSVPTALAMDSPAMAFNTAGTVSGTLSTALYGTPPGPVRLQVRAPATTGAWADAASTAALASGAWSLTYTPTNPSADYRAVYGGSGVYQASTSAEHFRSLALATATTVNVPAVLYPGTSSTWTGTVKDAQAKNVASGTVSLAYRAPGTAGWTTVSSGAVSGGSYSVAWTPNIVGAVEWRASFAGIAGFLASSSTATRKDIGLGTVALNKTGLDHTAIYTTWNAVAGATSYETLLNGGLTQDAADLGCWRGGLAQLTTYSYQTRAKAPDWYSGATVYGAWSGAVSGYTGRPESRYSGSFAYETRPSATNTWRPSDGWGYSGDDVLQGYYSASSNNAFGTMSYDGGAFQNWVRTYYGQGALDNLSWNHMMLYMIRRSGTGTGSSVTQTYYVSSAWAGQGGQPPLAGGHTMGSHPPNNAGTWDGGVPPHWAGHVLLNQDVGQGLGRSFVRYRNNAADYSRYYGMGDHGSACNLYVECSWNYVTASYVAPYWH